MDKPIVLYIINSAGTCLFHYEFKKDIQSLDPILFSGFLTAIMHFGSQMQSHLATTNLSQKISTISNISFDINIEFIIEHWKGVTGAMIVYRQSNTSELREFLKQVLGVFVEQYASILETWNNDLIVFEGFSTELQQISEKGRIYSYQIPNLIGTPSPNLKVVMTELEPYLDGTRSIQEIANLSKLSLNEVKDKISKLWWNDYVELSQIVDIDDIYEPRKELFYLIRSKPSNQKIKYVKNTQSVELEILRKINGFSTISEIDRELQDIPLAEIQKNISFYLSKGAYLRKVKLYPQIIQIEQKFKNQCSGDILALVFTLENICDGDLSLEDISRKIKVPILVIKAILNELKEYVTYRKEYEF